MTPATKFPQPQRYMMFRDIPADILARLTAPAELVRMMVNSLRIDWGLMNGRPDPTVIIAPVSDWEAIQKAGHNMPGGHWTQWTDEQMRQVEADGLITRVRVTFDGYADRSNP